jgi:hypothetical protein
MPAFIPGMKRLRSCKGIAIIVVAMAAVAGGGAAIAAAQDSPSSGVSSYLEGLARHLGVSTDELKDAMKAAALDEVSAAREDGRLTQEQADALKERIESGEVPPFFGAFLGPRHDRGLNHFPHPLPFHHHHHFFFEEKLSTAADYLGLSEDELEERLNEGSTLAEVAEAQGESVDGLKQALVDAAEERIDQAVEHGDLTQAEADDLLEGLERRIDAFVEHAFFRFHEDFAGASIAPGAPFS